MQSFVEMMNTAYDLFPDEFSKASDLIKKGILQRCGIWWYNAVLVFAVSQGKELTVPKYEEVFGDPGQHGITFPALQAYLRSMGIIH